MSFKKISGLVVVFCICVAVLAVGAVLIFSGTGGSDVVYAAGYGAGFEAFSENTTNRLSDIVSVRQWLPWFLGMIAVGAVVSGFVGWLIRRNRAS